MVRRRFARSPLNSIPAPGPCGQGITAHGGKGYSAGTLNLLGGSLYHPEEERSSGVTIAYRLRSRYGPGANLEGANLQGADVTIAYRLRSRYGPESGRILRWGVTPISQSPIGSGPDMDGRFFRAGAVRYLAGVTIAYRLRSRYGHQISQKLSWLKPLIESQSPIGSGPDMDQRRLSLNQLRRSSRSQSPIGSGPDMDWFNDMLANPGDIMPGSQSPIGSGPDMDFDTWRVLEHVKSTWSQSPIGSGPDMDFGQ